MFGLRLVEVRRQYWLGKLLPDASRRLACEVPEGGVVRWLRCG